ncbi:MAG: NUDIX hydrolase [Chloroflexaceae bacterium]|nr:NUDIX hydrolase [Chloroflexaceae bacterium]
MTDPQWLDWAKRLQAIAQIGLTYSENPYDIERYKAIQGLAAEILAAQTGTALPQILDWLAAEFGYATPKVDVRGAIFQGETILLVRERSDNCWTLSGGWADVGDGPARAVEQEILEESGFLARATKLVAVCDRNQHPHPPHPHHVYKLFFQCELLGGTPRPSLETSEVDFFEENALPELSLGRVTPGQIALLFEHYRHPTLPTRFD